MLSLNFDPFPILETQRLTLHEISPENAGDMFLLRSNPVAMKFIGKHLSKSIIDAEELIELYRFNVKNNVAITWGITLKSESTGLLGNIGFHQIDRENYRAEIGYMLHPDQWYKGIINEAITSVLDFGFNILNLHSMEARVNTDNHDSTKLLLKHGFIKEAHFKEDFYSDGKFLDTEVYSLLRK